MTYIVDMITIVSDSALPSPPAGYTRIDVDLNSHAGGKFIYLCYKTGTSASDAISGFYYLKEQGAVPPEGYTKINVDLNKGAGGKYIYLCFTKNPRLNPITDVCVINGNNGGIQPLPGFTKLGQDLNEGASGDYVYLCYKSAAR